MTISVEKPIFEEVSAFEKSGDNIGELKLDGGFSMPKMDTNDDEAFLAPEMNAFGRQFRDYDVESERQKGVEEFYRLQHINQTVDFVKKMRAEYGKLDKMVMSIWECCELLNEVVDESDPDLDEPQIQHLLQSAEAIRKDYPNEDWLHLTALIHGKFVVTNSLFYELIRAGTIRPRPIF
jgi:inositol oxygenase